MMRGLTFLFVQVALLRGVLGAVVLPLAGTLLGVGVLCLWWWNILSKMFSWSIIYMILVVKLYLYKGMVMVVEMRDGVTYVETFSLVSQIFIS